MEFQTKGKSEKVAKSESRSFFDVSEHFANIANHALITITTFYITWHSFTAGFNDNMTIHAWFGTVGYQFFMSEGILALYSKDIYSRPVRERWMKRRVHWILQAIGGCMALFGVVFEIYIRENANRKHFNSTHGLTGLVSGIFLILTIISGCPALFSVELRRYIKPLFSKATHNILSVVCYVVGMISIINAYDKRWIVRHDPGEVRFIMVWCLWFVTAFTLIGPLKTAYSQARDFFTMLRTQFASDC